MCDCDKPKRQKAVRKPTGKTVARHGPHPTPPVAPLQARVKEKGKRGS